VCVCERMSFHVHSMITHDTHKYHPQGGSHVFKACMSLISMLADGGHCCQTLPKAACMAGQVWPIAGATVGQRNTLTTSQLLPKAELISLLEFAGQCRPLLHGQSPDCGAPLARVDSSTAR